MNRKVIALATLLAAPLLAHAGRLEYRVTASGDSSSFECVETSSNVCVLTVDTPGDPKAEKIPVEKGASTKVPNPKFDRKYCVSVKEAEWPKCLSDRNSGELTRSTSSSQVWLDAERN